MLLLGWRAHKQWLSQKKFTQETRRKRWVQLPAKQISIWMKPLVFHIVRKMQ